jgi:MFS family permease
MSLSKLCHYWGILECQSAPCFKGKEVPKCGGVVAIISLHITRRQNQIGTPNRNRKDRTENSIDYVRYLNLQKLVEHIPPTPTAQRPDVKDHNPNTAMTNEVKLPETSLWANRRCLGICIIVAIANMQYGLDSAVVGSLQAMPGFLVIFGYPDPDMAGGYGIDGTFQRLIGSLLTLGAFLSSLVAGVFALFFGRKVALWLACLLNVIACAIQISTVDKGAVYVGRLLLGIANGFLVTFSNIYTAEAAPAHLRAVMVALFSEWVNIGSIIGSAVTNATRGQLDKASYQIPLGTLFIVPVVLSIGLLWVPESPRYLLYCGKQNAARKALLSIRGDSLSYEDLELEWTEMVKGIEEEKQSVQTIGPLDMFRGKSKLSLALINLRLKSIRHGSTAHPSLLWCYRNPGRVWILVHH